MKRVLSILFICALLLSLISGCSQETLGDPPVEPPTEQSVATPDVPPDNLATGEKLSIVCTIFPQYDWVMNILGEKAGNMDTTLLISSTVDLHSYNPSVSDIAKISTADIFICVGGDSDDWVEGAMRQVTNPDMVVINLLDVLGDGAKLEEIIEGMQHDHEYCEDEDDCDDPEHGHDHGHSHSHSHDHGHDDDCDDDDECDAPDHDHNDDGDEHHHHGEVDEHVWLSLRNAVIFCHTIAEAITSLDPVNADLYLANLNNYIDRLLSLDEEYATVLDNVPGNTLLFADRFPFRYLVDDFGLNYYAAFTGCSAETEASFSTILFLAGKVDELALHTVMITESGSQAIAEAVISNTAAGNQQILVLDSMQAVTTTDILDGAAFLSIMESNLLVLKNALS